jgi:hypothetical protein
MKPVSTPAWLLLLGASALSALSAHAAFCATPPVAFTQRNGQTCSCGKPGKVELRGSARVAAVDDDDGSEGTPPVFEVDWGRSAHATALRARISDLRLDNAAIKALKLDKAVAGRKCVGVTARIRLQGITLVLDDSDLAGAYPDRVQVLQLSGHRPCRTQ